MTHFNVTDLDITDIDFVSADYFWKMGYNEFNFSCKINGETDTLCMVHQRMDDGYGIVIRAEKNDFWDRLSTKEVYELESLLLDEVKYKTYHNKIEQLTTLEEYDDLCNDFMSDEDVHLNNVKDTVVKELIDKRQELEDQLKETEVDTR